MWGYLTFLYVVEISFGFKVVEQLSALLNSLVQFRECMCICECQIVFQIFKQFCALLYYLFIVGSN